MIFPTLCTQCNTSIPRLPPTYSMFDIHSDRNIGQKVRLVAAYARGVIHGQYGRSAAIQSQERFVGIPRTQETCDSTSCIVQLLGRKHKMKSPVSCRIFSLQAVPTNRVEARRGGTKVETRHIRYSNVTNACGDENLISITAKDVFQIPSISNFLVMEYTLLHFIRTDKPL